jgi:ribokinase
VTIWNLGSINVDLIYRVPHIPQPGETLAATGKQTFLGGKGANMSVAAARAGATVRHIGAVGQDGDWAVQRLASYGVDTSKIAKLDADTGEAIIAVSDDGENSIIISPGANRAILPQMVGAALSAASSGDWVVTQNETSAQVDALSTARANGLHAAYAAAPFEAASVLTALPHIDLLILNQVEMEQLAAALGKGAGDLGVAHVVVTLGAEGSDLYSAGAPAAVRFPAHKVTPIDTTGAGDTFTGYLLAGLDRGEPIETALNRAGKAAAIMVTRLGTADVIPTLAEVDAFEG